MKALTVLQPFASALVRGVKPVENRTWPPPPSLKLGEWLVIHAGKKVIDYHRPWLNERWAEVSTGFKEGFPRGVIIGACRYNGVSGPIPTAKAEQLYGPWAFGPYCWRFDAFVAFPEKQHIPAIGKQGLWSLDADVQATVLTLIQEHQK